MANQGNPHVVYLKELNIINAKGLEDIQIKLAMKGVHCITGPNGVGKSTILHLLANAFQQDDIWVEVEPFLHDYTPNQGYTFPDFFETTKKNDWEGMQFQYKFSNDAVFNFHRKRSGKRIYWPRYKKRPLGPIFYTGLNFLATEVEVDRRQTPYTLGENKPPKQFTDEMKKDVLKWAERILGKKYNDLFFYEKEGGKVKKFIGVRDGLGCEYTSYEMGAGERKIFYLLIWLNMLPTNSLVLIDEPEALLYSTATKELFDFFVKTSQKKCLQTVCTTHWENIGSMEEINLFTLDREKNKKISIKSGTDAVTLQTMRLGGVDSKILMVEDAVAELIVAKILQEEEKELFYFAKSFGSVGRFPIIISSLIKCEDKNFWAISDGDVQIKWQSGIDLSHDIDESKLIDKHVSFLPDGLAEKGDGKSPEEILLQYGKNALSESAQKYIANMQKTAKERINALVKNFHRNEDILINSLIEAFAHDHPKEWEAYTKDVRAKIKADKD